MIRPVRFPIVLALLGWTLALGATQAGVLPPDRNRLFGLVGGIGQLNRHCVEMRAAGLDLIIDTGRELDPAGQARAAGLLRRNRPLLVKLRASIRKDKAMRSLPAKLRHVLLRQHGNRLDPAFVIVAGTDWNQYFRMDPASGRLEADEHYNHLPPLKIKNEWILRADTDDRIIFKGVSFFYNKSSVQPGSGLFALIKSNVEQNEQLGIVSNLIRLSYFSHQFTEDDFSQLAGIEKFLDQKGIYLALTPHNVQTDALGNYIPMTVKGQPLPANYYLPSELDGTVLGLMARRLGGFNNVIYGIWNEPASTTWKGFEATLRSISSQIWATVADGQARPLLLVPGMDWSRDFRDARIPLPKDSYLVDVHEYPLKFKNDIKYMYGSMINKVPVLFSEMGGSLSRDYRPQSAEDIARIRMILFQTVDAPESIGATHYCIWKGTGDPDGIRNPGGGLSARGRLVREEKQRFPTQYDFIQGRSAMPQDGPGHPAAGRTYPRWLRWVFRSAML